MFRRSLSIAFSICLVLVLGHGVALACGEGGKCDVERTCTKTETGMTCVIKAKGETTVEQVRACVREHAGSHHAMEGVKVEVNDIDGGVEVVMTAGCPDSLKALHARGEGCCAKGEHTCDKHAAAHAEGHECGKDCPEDCPHAKAAAAKAAHAEHTCDKHAEAHAEGHECGKDCPEDCPHAKAAAAKAAHAGHECSRDCSKDCPHAHAAAKEGSATGGCASRKAD